MTNGDILQTIRRFGGVTTDALLDSRTEFFSLPGREGLIGYRKANGAVVVLGDPVAPADAIVSLAEAFQSHFEKQNVEIVYLLASESFKAVVNCPIAIGLADLLYVDPVINPFDNQGERGSLVRRKVRRALNEGVTCVEWHDGDEKGLEEVAKIWQEGRKGRQAHISKPALFENRFGKRWIVAYLEGRPIGLAVLNRLEEKNGWLLNHLMHLPSAPHGTSELLVITALEKVASQGCRYVTFGVVPLETLGEVSGLGAINEQLSRLLFMALKRLFLSGGLNSFWSKFEPRRANAYLLFNQKKITPKALLSLTRALNISI